MNGTDDIYDTDDPDIMAQEQLDYEIKRRKAGLHRSDPDRDKKGRFIQGNRAGFTHENQPLPSQKRVPHRRKKGGKCHTDRDPATGRFINKSEADKRESLAKLEKMTRELYMKDEYVEGLARLIPGFLRRSKSYDTTDDKSHRPKEAKLKGEDKRPKKVMINIAANICREQYAHPINDSKERILEARIFAEVDDETIEMIKDPEIRDLVRTVKTRSEEGCSWG